MEVNDIVGLELLKNVMEWINSIIDVFAYSSVSFLPEGKVKNYIIGGKDEPRPSELFAIAKFFVGFIILGIQTVDLLFFSFGNLSIFQFFIWFWVLVDVLKIIEIFLRSEQMIFGIKSFLLLVKIFSDIGFLIYLTTEGLS